MSLDLRVGDLAVDADKDYPIVWVGEYENDIGSTASMKHMCSKTIGTKRKPDVVDNKRGDPITLLSGVKCTPFDPASDSTRQIIIREFTKAPVNIYEAIVDGGDVFYKIVIEKVRK